MSYPVANTIDNAAWDDQPFCCLNDEAYDSILQRLQNGERFAKSYAGTCPLNHKKCSCKFALNFLNADGKIVRSTNGKIKRVFKESAKREMYEYYSSLETNVKYPIV